MKRKLVISFEDERTRWAITPAALETLQSSLPHDWELSRIRARVSSRGDGSGISDEALIKVRGAEVYAGFGFPRDLFMAATSADDNLRWVHSGAAGVATLLYQEMRDSSIILTNSAGIHAAPMAETVLAMMLHFARGFDFAVHARSKLAWDQSRFESVESPVTELAGGTVGIIGLGGIGRAVAKLAYALGMRVMSIRRTHREPGDLDRLLGESDFVVITAPSTPETRGLLDVTRLAQMKPTAVLINVSRGNIVAEAALIDALRAGRLRGAALDVFEQEPLPATSELWQLPNVLITPHVSATTPRFWDRQIELIVDNFNRYLRGEPLRNVVNKVEGY